MSVLVKKYCDATGAARRRGLPDRTLLFHWQCMEGLEELERAELGPVRERLGRADLGTLRAQVRCEGTLPLDLSWPALPSCSAGLARWVCCSSGGCSSPAGAW
eukprot:COSAG01_NODE_134_length_24525_cov_434.185172_10_plen_103_part_00